MSFRVFLTDDAARDLEDIHDYIVLHDLPGKADHVLDRMEKAFIRNAFGSREEAINRAQNMHKDLLATTAKQPETGEHP